MDGLTDIQIAHNIGIAPSTLYEWKNKYSVISESLKKGKEVVDREVENKLYRNAIGYEYEETKTIIDILPDGSKKQRVEKMKKYAQPDTTAQIFWLRNRKGKVWSNKDDIEIQRLETEMKKMEAETDKITKENETDAPLEITIVDAWTDANE